MDNQNEQIEKEKKKKTRPYSAMPDMVEPSKQQQQQQHYSSKKIRPASALPNFSKQPSYLQPTYSSFRGRNPPILQQQFNESLSKSPRKDIYVPKINKNPPLFERKPLPADVNLDLSGRTSPIISPTKTDKYSKRNNTSDSTKLLLQELSSDDDEDDEEITLNGNNVGKERTTNHNTNKSDEDNVLRPLPISSITTSQQQQPLFHKVRSSGSSGYINSGRMSSGRYNELYNVYHKPITNRYRSGSAPSKRKEKDVNLSEFTKFCLMQLKDEDIDRSFIANMQKMGFSNRLEVIKAIEKYKGEDWVRKHVKID